MRKEFMDTYIDTEAGMRGGEYLGDDVAALAMAHDALSQAEVLTRKLWESLNPGGDAPMGDMSGYSMYQREYVCQCVQNINAGVRSLRSDMYSLLEQME